MHLNIYLFTLLDFILNLFKQIVLTSFNCSMFEQHLILSLDRFYLNHGTM